MAAHKNHVAFSIRFVNQPFNPADQAVINHKTSMYIPLFYYSSIDKDCIFSFAPDIKTNNCSKSSPHTSP